MTKRLIEDLVEVLECCNPFEVTRDTIEFLSLRDRLSNEPVPEEFQEELAALDERAASLFENWTETDWALTGATWRPRRTPTPSTIPSVKP